MTKTVHLFHWATVGCLIVLAARSSVACADTLGTSAAAGSTEEPLAEIVVTAQKRVQNLQDVPIAASVLSQDDLLQRGITDALDLGAVVPSLKIDTPYGNAYPKITLRGIGSASFNQNTESAVALYLDEFVLDPGSSKLGQLFDVERVEVLRGPQGTLYGKNSTGGAINYVSRRPDGTTEADGEVTVGRFGQAEFEGGAQTALSDNLSMRVSMRREGSDGYAYNPNTDQRLLGANDWDARVGLRYKTDDVDAYFKIFGDSSRESGGYVTALGVNPNGSPRPNNTNPVTGYAYGTDYDICDCNPIHSYIYNSGATLNVDVDLHPVILSSITGYLDSRSYQQTDDDWSPFPLVATNPFNSESTELTQEFRVASPATGPFTWIAGASYFYLDQTINDGYLLTYVGLPPVNIQDHELTMSFAGFFDLTYQINDIFSVFGGARVTTDHKNFDSAAPFSLAGPFDIAESHRWTEPTYRAGLNIHVDPNTLVYASYNRGYRSGEYDTSFITTPAQFKPVNPEFVNNYEVGYKTTAFERRLRLSTDVFYTQYMNQQLLQLGTTPGSICCSLVNAGRSRIYGVEMEAVARVTDQFDVNLQATYLNARIQEYTSGTTNYAGATLPNVPDYQIRLGADYHVPFEGGEVFVAPTVNSTGRTRATTTTSPDPYSLDVQTAYITIDGQLGYRTADHRYSGFLWIKNATDRRYMVDFASFSSLGFDQRVWSAPTTFGLTLTGRY